MATDNQTGSKVSFDNKDGVDTQMNQFHFKSTKPNKDSQCIKVPIDEPERNSSNHLYNIHYEDNNCIPNAAEYRKPFGPDFLGSTMQEKNDELEALRQTVLILAGEISKHGRIIRKLERKKH